MPWCPRAAHPARLPGNQPCPRGKPTPRRQKSRPLVKSSGNGNTLLLPHCLAKTLHNQSSGTIFLPPALRKSQMQVRPCHCQRTLLQMGQAISLSGLSPGPGCLRQSSTARQEVQPTPRCGRIRCSQDASLCAGGVGLAEATTHLKSAAFSRV